MEKGNIWLQCIFCSPTIYQSMFVFHIRFLKLLPQKMMIKSAISTNVMTKKIW